jgi:hypothetical protein
MPASPPGRVPEATCLPIGDSTVRRASLSSLEDDGSRNGRHGH